MSIYSVLHHTILFELFFKYFDAKKKRSLLLDPNVISLFLDFPRQLKSAYLNNHYSLGNSLVLKARRIFKSIVTDLNRT